MALGACLGVALGEDECQGHHADAQQQVEDVVEAVERHEIPGRFLGDDQSIDEQDQVDDAAVEEEGACAGGGPGQGEACGAEKQVDDVVQGRDLEDAQQKGPGMVAGEVQLVLACGDSRNEAQEADQQEHGTDNHRCLLDLGAGCHAGGQSAFKAATAALAFR